MSEEPVYIGYSEDIREAIASADVDLEELVRKELENANIQATVSLAPDPFDPDSKDKDVFLLIMASGVAVSLIGTAVARVIDALAKKDRVKMTVSEVQVATDAKGRPLLDQHGNTIHNTKTTPAEFPTSGKEQTSFVAGKFLKFSSSRS